MLADNAAVLAEFDAVGIGPAVANLGMGLCLGPDDALIEQSGVQLVVALEPQPPTPRDLDRVGAPGWCEQPLPDDANLVLDLPLLP